MIPQVGNRVKISNAWVTKFEQLPQSLQNVCDYKDIEENFGKNAIFDVVSVSKNSINNITSIILKSQSTCDCGSCVSDPDDCGDECTQFSIRINDQGFNVDCPISEQFFILDSGTQNTQSQSNSAPTLKQLNTRPEAVNCAKCGAPLANPCPGWHTMKHCKICEP